MSSTALFPQPSNLFPESCKRKCMIRKDHLFLLVKDDIFPHQHICLLAIGQESEQCDVIGGNVDSIGTDRPLVTLDTHPGKHYGLPLHISVTVIVLMFQWSAVRPWSSSWLPSCCQQPLPANTSCTTSCDSCDHSSLHPGTSCQASPCCWTTRASSQLIAQTGEQILLAIVSPLNSIATGS